MRDEIKAGLILRKDSVYLFQFIHMKYYNVKVSKLKFTKYNTCNERDRTGIANSRVEESWSPQLKSNERTESAKLDRSELIHTQVN